MIFVECLRIRIFSSLYRCSPICCVLDVSGLIEFLHVNEKFSVVGLVTRFMLAGQLLSVLYSFFIDLAKIHVEVGRAGFF